MKQYIETCLMTALLIGWGCMMTCCSSDGGDDDEQQNEMSLQVASVTRTGDEETLAPNPLPWGDIKLFMFNKPDENALYPLSSDHNDLKKRPQIGTITYNGLEEGGDIVWNTSRLEVKPGRNYYIFGYMPAGIGSDNTVQVADATTATMTFNGLPTVTDEDICIVVGVKGGKQALNASNQGSFTYHAPENTTEGYFVSLLADHLYASVEFRVTIANDYNVLRKVMLKKMTLKCNDKDKAVQDLVLTLTMNDDGTYPLADNLSPTQKAAADNKECEYPLYEATGDSQGKELLETYSEELVFSGCFAEGCGAYLSVECEYDIYDRVSGANNKIETRTVVNGLKSLLQNLKRGSKKVINLLVDPTYLYQLSDGDVDK